MLRFCWLPETSSSPTWPSPTSSSASSPCPSPCWTLSQSTGCWGQIWWEQTVCCAHSSFYFKEFVCKLLDSFQATCVFFSSFSILMIAMDRYRFILQPRHRQISVQMVRMCQLNTSSSHNLFKGHPVVCVKPDTLCHDVLPLVPDHQAGGVPQPSVRGGNLLLLWGSCAFTFLKTFLDRIGLM